MQNCASENYYELQKYTHHCFAYPFVNHYILLSNMTFWLLDEPMT